MSEFTENAFRRKLAELTMSQQSIQGLSTWLLHHRKHHPSIVATWYKEFLRAEEQRKLTLVYLANDVIQTSRKKGDEFGNSFESFLSKTFEHMARVPGEKTKSCVLRILKIWEDRAIFDVNLVKDFESSYRKAWNDLHGPDFIELLEEEEHVGVGTQPPAPPSNKSKGKSRKGKRRKHKHSHSKGRSDGPQKWTKSKKEEEEEVENRFRERKMEVTNSIEERVVDGVAKFVVKLRPSPCRAQPREADLIQMVKALENMPSTDAITREQIANLPPEVSNEDGVDEICIDSDVSRVLQRQTTSAADLLLAYNGRLDGELEERKRASMKLQDMIHFEKGLLSEAEQRLQEHQSHIQILSQTLEEIMNHVLSFPDLTKLPSVHDGLAPLPSAGDLFNV